MTQPYTDANMGTLEDDVTVVPLQEETWSTKIPGIRKADHVTVLFHGSVPLFTVVIKGGSTLKALFQSIDRGLHTPITEDHMGDAYMKIGQFKKGARGVLARRAEAGTLCPVHLIGDHSYYEGHLMRTRVGIGRGHSIGVWTYWTGS